MDDRELVDERVNIRVQLVVEVDVGASVIVVVPTIVAVTVCRFAVVVASIKAVVVVVGWNNGLDMTTFSDVVDDEVDEVVDEDVEEVVGETVNDAIIVHELNVVRLLENPNRSVFGGHPKHPTKGLP